MNNCKWTAGPWRVERDPTGESGFAHMWPTIVSDSREIIGTEGIYGDNMDEDIANAHLIAAAPELYEALENLLAVVYGEGGTKPNASMMAADALAKARGES